MLVYLADEAETTMPSIPFLVAANTADGDVVVNVKIAPLILRLPPTWKPG